MSRRRDLAAALATVAPWIDDPDVGPRAVDAGECDRCGHQPRWVQTCGAQAWRAVCRDCLIELRQDLFCTGHASMAADAVRKARRLPEDWATLTRLAWIATGEVHPDDEWLALVRRTTGRTAIAAALPG